MSCKYDYENFNEVRILENDNEDKRNYDAWTEISVPEILKIPICKPDIESIEKVIVTSKITDKRIMASSSLHGFDDQEDMRLKSTKLVVDGILYQNILYTPSGPEQDLVAVDFEAHFSTYIVVEEDMSICENKFCVNICVEDVFIQMIDARNIFKNVTLFLEAVDLCTTI